MIVLSEAGANAALDAIGGLLNGGHIELLTGSGDVIAVLQLSSPAAMAAEGGELELNKIAEGDAIIAGVVTTGRICSADGGEIFLCDVGTADSAAVIRLGTTRISLGAPIRLNSFRLSMPQ